MTKAKGAIKNFVAMFLCGISAISLFPSSNYTSMIPSNTGNIEKAGWELTGEIMKKTIDKVSGELGRKT